MYAMVSFESEASRGAMTHALEFAARQVRSLIESDPGFYPMYTDQGRWRHTLPAWTHWCDGFLPGMMWIFSERGVEPGREWWHEQAIRYSRPLEPRQFDRDVHDLGFIFLSTYRRWLDVCAEPALEEVLIQAGRTMALLTTFLKASTFSSRKDML
jgi:unsaturated chondroitin disaccharide hydrolase